MKKYILQSSYSDFIQIIFYAFSLQIIGFFIYGLYTMDAMMITVMTIFALFFYFAFLRKGLKYKNIRFDKDYIYYSNKQVSLQQIRKLEAGKRTLIDKEAEEVVYYNSLFGSNRDLLNEFIEQGVTDSLPHFKKPI